MAKNVIVFSTSTCPWCVKVKEFLKQNNIKYTEKNVGEDQKAADYMIEKTGQMGVPVTEIDGKFVVGFDVAGLKKALGLK